LRDGFRLTETIALVAAYLAPAVFKIGLYDNALKLSVIAAAGLLFAVVLRRMMQRPAGFKPDRVGVGRNADVRLQA
jgi:hypothetical protein